MPRFADSCSSQPPVAVDGINTGVAKARPIHCANRECDLAGPWALHEITAIGEFALLCPGSACHRFGRGSPPPRHRDGENAGALAGNLFCVRTLEYR